MEFLDNVTNTLHIPEDQAKAGIGLLMRAAKAQLPEDQYAKLSTSLPDLGECVDAAPESGMFSMLFGKATSVLGEKATHLGSMTNLASGFSKAGMSKDMVEKLLPLLLDYAQKQGGDDVKGILEKVLH